MAVTVSNYNHTAKLLLGAEVDHTDLAIMLLDETASFNASNVTLADVAGVSNDKEVYGNGWEQGGENLSNVAASIVTTNDAILDCDDPVVTATGGPIGPAYAAVIYEKTTEAPLQYIDFGEAVTAGEATDFRVIISANGIFRLDYTLPA